VSGLDLHGNVHVSDLKLPAGVRTEHDPEALVFAVEYAASEEALEAGTEEAAELEVIKEKKKEDAPEAKEGDKGKKA
jgi:hypothetical protein